VTLFGISAHPSVTLAKDAHYLLTSGAVSEIAIRAVNLAGRQGSAGTARYIPSSRDIPQPPPDRPLLRSVDAIQ
jgi:hypothetical protein